MHVFVVSQKFFDLIASKQKTKEYRSPSPHNVSQMLQILQEAYENGDHAIVKFAAGYKTGRDELTCKVFGISFGNADAKRQTELAKLEKEYFEGENLGNIPNFLSLELNDKIIYHLTKT